VRLEGDAAEAMAKLKELPGAGLLKFGTGGLDRTLLDHRLVDEFHFWFFPVLAGGGRTRVAREACRPNNDSNTRSIARCWRRAGRGAAASRPEERFFTEVFGVSLKVFGDVSRHDELESEGSLLDESLVATYGEGGRLVGALTVGQSEEIEAELQQLIASRAPLRAARGELEERLGVFA
jgi:RibD C-terminal domain